MTITGLGRMGAENHTEGGSQGLKEEEVRDKKIKRGVKRRQN